MSQQNQLQDYVESRLKEWGSWIKNTKLPYLGYQKSSLCMQRQSSSLVSYDEEFAKEMERLLLELQKEFPREAKVLKAYYSTDDDTTDIARKQKTSLRMVNYRLKSGKTFLAGRLAHKIEGYE